MQALQILRSAYRCTIEEQDDPAVWIAHAMKKAGAELGVLLTANAVCYATNGQDASGLSFGGVSQTQPPRLDHDLSALLAEGVPVWVIEEDCAERGVDLAGCVEGLRPIARAAVPGLFAEFDQIWQW